MSTLEELKEQSEKAIAIAREAKAAARESAKATSRAFAVADQAYDFAAIATAAYDSALKARLDDPTGRAG